MTTVVLWADRWEEMISFYAALLQSALEPSVGQDFVAISGFDNEVLLHQTPAEFLPDMSQAPPARETAAIKPVFTVDSLAAARSRVSGVMPAASGATLDGWRYCDAIDPDGNVVQIRAR